MSIRNFFLIFLITFFGIENCNPVSEEKISPGIVTADTITSATRDLLLPCQITERFTYDALHFDPSKQKNGRLSYRLSKAAWIRIQVVLRRDPGLLIRTIVDWKKQGAGTHTLFWDGRDSSGHLIDKNKYPCMIIFEADKEVHRAHDWSRCNELNIKLRLSKKVRLRENASLQVPFAIAASRSGYIKETGFTARLYIDFERVLEKNFPANNKYRYVIDLPVSSVIAGTHVLTLAVSDGADHSGAVSRRVRFLDEE